MILARSQRRSPAVRVLTPSLSSRWDLGSHHRALAQESRRRRSIAAGRIAARTMRSEPAEEAQIVSSHERARATRSSPRSSSCRSSPIEGLYLASESTFYRLQRRYGLRSDDERHERTDVTRASTLHRATRPNQVWSWDITWLPTTVRGIYLYLYLVMDVWSRRIVGWRIAEGDSADIAARTHQPGVPRGQASIRAASCCTPTTASRCAPAP